MLLCGERIILVSLSLIGIWILGRAHYVYIPRGVLVSLCGGDMSLHEGVDIG